MTTKTLRRPVLALVMVAITLLIVGGFAYAQSTDPESNPLVPCGRVAQGQQGRCTLCHLILGFQNLVNYGVGIVLVIALAAISVAGVMYVISGGNPSMMTTAKTFIKNVIIGLVVVLGAWLIINTTIFLLAPATNLGINDNKEHSWWKITCSTTPVALVQPVVAQCNDGRDNDNDGKIDFKADGTGDPDCLSVTDESEVAMPECNDGKDNDNNNAIDYPQDSGCESFTDTTERGGIMQSCGYHAMGQCVNPGASALATAVSTDARCAAFVRNLLGLDTTQWLAGGTSCRTSNWCCARRIEIGQRCYGLPNNTPTFPFFSSTGLPNNEKQGTCKAACDTATETILGTTSSENLRVIDNGFGNYGDLYPDCANGGQCCVANAAVAATNPPAPVPSAQAVNDPVNPARGLSEIQVYWKWPHGNSWTGAGGVLTSFEVTRVEGNVKLPDLAVDPTTVLDPNFDYQVVDTGLLENTAYNYEVVAVDSLGNRSQPGRASARTRTFPTPRDFTCDSTNPTSVTFSWRYSFDWGTSFVSEKVTPWDYVSRFDVYMDGATTPVASFLGSGTPPSRLQSTVTTDPNNPHSFVIRAVMKNSPTFKESTPGLCPVTATPQPGACGTATAQPPSATPPSTGLCSVGTLASGGVTANMGSSTWVWVCNGLNGGSSRNCSAPMIVIVPPTCGIANGKMFTSAPSVDLCASGTASSVTTSGGTYSWSCSASGSPSATCNASRATIQLVGSCTGSGCALQWRGIDGSSNPIVLSGVSYFQAVRNGSTSLVPTIAFNPGLPATGAYNTVDSGLIPGSYTYQVNGYSTSGTLMVTSNVASLTVIGTECGYSNWGTCYDSRGAANGYPSYSAKCRSLIPYYGDCYMPVQITEGANCGGQDINYSWSNSIGTCQSSCASPSYALSPNIAGNEYPSCGSGLTCCFLRRP